MSITVAAFSKFRADLFQSRLPIGVTSSACAAVPYSPLRIVGRTPTGRATVAALHLDSDPIALEVRSYWITAGWHPPVDPSPGR